MKGAFQGASDSSEPGALGEQKKEDPHENLVCPKCGLKLGEENPAQLCPVCLLRMSFEIDSDDPSESAGEPGNAISALEQAVPPSEPPGHIYGHFRIEIKEDGTPFELGRGAMGVTYKATDTNLHRLVALKVISPQYVRNESTRQRFVREARAAASLRHENIASVFHLGSTDPGYFYAMEFVEGQTLEQIIDSRGSLAQEAALEITWQVAAALSAAHQHQLVHRDIKPANLMVSFKSDDHPMVKVIDFGLVKTVGISPADSIGTTPGTFFGTMRYASPEQIRQGRADIRSDIYSLGITLWETLVGEVPFDGTPGEIADQHLHAPLPLAKVQHLGRPVVSLLCNMLEKDPGRRPQTPEELLAILRAVGTHSASDRGAVVLARRVAPAFPHDVFATRNMLMVAGITLFMLVAIGLYFLGPKFSSSQVDPKSVAVLPFDYVGDDKQNEYFSDGLTTEVIFQLSKISDLRVISRSSVLRYKTVANSVRTPLRQIGAELEVATILESTVQRLENRIKITTILYDARTSRRLWGDAYDREIKDLFSIQSDVAENIAAALQVRLSADERASLLEKPTNNLTAYDLYLRGMALYGLRHQDDNENAIALFRQAVDQDPKFALGYVGLANAYIDRVGSYEGEMFWLDSAVDLCRKAIALDPRLVRGYIGLARAYAYNGMDKEARELTKKALELAPNDVESNKRARYQAEEEGRLDDEYALLRKCHILDPNDPSEAYLLATVSATVGDRELMEKWMQRALDLEADPKRHRMIECERMIFRGDYSGALIGLRDLPLDLRSYNHTVLELTVACSMRVGDWPTVVRLASVRLEQGSGNWLWDSWALSYLGLAARHEGHESEAREKGDRLLASVREALAGAEPHTWDRYYLALGNRLLDRKEEAYEHLRIIFPRILRNLPLMRDDPTINVFVSDNEFQGMMSAAEKKAEATRRRIEDIEKSFF